MHLHLEQLVDSLNFFAIWEIIHVPKTARAEDQSLDIQLSNNVDPLLSELLS